MASATVDSAAAPNTTDGGLLRLDSIPIVDLRLLSQSELYSLSRCSSSDSDPSRRDDIVIPIIDRSVFNESAGSRKQTFSRYRLAPSDSSSSATPRSRTPHLRSTGAAYGAIKRKSDPENSENDQIINLLKQFFVADMNPGDLYPVKIEYSNLLQPQHFSSPTPSSPSNVIPTVLKRKRGRPRRNEFIMNGQELAVEVSVIDANDVDMLPTIPLLDEMVVRQNAAEDMDREVLNSDGVAVDLAALGAVDHPYWEEIRHRTEGLLTEEKLLDFLNGLNGMWASRRKKKRIVDASEFGPKLPVGWKLLLSVKKKNGHVWLYCRRYISPSGLHFVSCKGVSSYLLSLYGVHNTNLFSSAQYNDIVNDSPRVNNNQHSNYDPSNQTRNNLELDSQRLAVNDSIFDLFGTQGDEDKNLALSIKEKSHLEYLPCKDSGTTESMSTSGLGASKIDEDPAISVLPVADNEKPCLDDNISYTTVKHKVDETLSFGKCNNESSKADNGGAIRHEEMQFGMASVIQSWDGQENVSKKDDTEVFTHLLELPGVQGMSKSQFIADNESIFHYENNDGGVCSRETKVPEFDSVGTFGNGQSSDIFSSSCARISSNSISGTEQDTRLGVRSSFTSTTDKQLSGEDNMIMMFNDTMEERRQDTSEGILLDQSGVSGVSNEAYTSNKIYTTPANPSELDGIENAVKHELSLSFGSLQTDMCAESNRVEQESYQANSFNIATVVNKTFADPTRSSIVSSNIAADLEQDRPFGYPNLSFNNSTHDPGNSFNVAHPERGWDGTRGNKIRNTSQNFMVDFGNSSLQTSESVAADGSWRTDRDNVFGDCFDSSSGPNVPSSNFFPTFGLEPNKGQESTFGVNHNYGIQNDTLRPGRTQPVEYSFMGEQRVSSLPAEAKIFPYSTNTEEGIDTSFWLGKDALTPNTSHASQATSVCVWCRNVFFHDPVQAGMQTGAIGTICPSCSSRIPGQFNVL